MPLCAHSAIRAAHYRHSRDQTAWITLLRLQAEDAGLHLAVRLAPWRQQEEVCRDFHKRVLVATSTVRPCRKNCRELRDCTLEHEHGYSCAFSVKIPAQHDKHPAPRQAAG